MAKGARLCENQCICPPPDHCVRLGGGGGFDGGGCGGWGVFTPLCAEASCSTVCRLNRCDILFHNKHRKKARRYAKSCVCRRAISVQPFFLTFAHISTCPPHSLSVIALMRKKKQPSGSEKLLRDERNTKLCAMLRVRKRRLCSEM